MNKALIAEIEVGHRHRTQLGDIESLAASIRENELLHPVVVTPKMELIAGRRRLEAFRLLGRASIPVRVVDVASIVRGERAENADRLDLTPSEAVKIWEAVEAEERAAAKKRQGGPGHKRSGKLPERGVSGRPCRSFAFSFSRLFEHLPESHGLGNLRRTARNASVSAC